MNNAQIKVTTEHIKSRMARSFLKDKRNGHQTHGFAYVTAYIENPDNPDERLHDKAQTILADTLEVEVTVEKELYKDLIVYNIKKIYLGYEFTTTEIEQVSPWGGTRTVHLYKPIMDKPVRLVSWQAVARHKDEGADIAKPKWFGSEFLVTTWSGCESKQEAIENLRKRADDYDKRLARHKASFALVTVLQDYAIKSINSASTVVRAGDACRPLTVGEPVWFWANGGDRKGIITATNGTKNISVAFVTPTSPTEIKARRVPITSCRVLPTVSA